MSSIWYLPLGFRQTFVHVASTHSFTTGNSKIAVCQNLCRVLKHGHTANRTFAVCQKKQHTTKVQLTVIFLFAVCPPKKTHGKDTTHGKHVCLLCAEKGCTQQAFSTRQRAPVCRVPAILHTANLWHTAKLCKKKVDTTLPIFLLCIYSVLYSLLKSVIFLVILAIFSHLISLIDFLGFNLKCFE